MKTPKFFNISDNRLHFAEQSDLSDDEKWLVTVAGVFSSLVGDNLNTIETGRDNGTVREALRHQWLISDRASFEQAVVRLATSDKRHLYLKRLNMIKKFYDVLAETNIVCKSLSKISLHFALDWYKTKTKEDLKKVSKELELDRVKIGDSKNNEFYDLLANARVWTKELEKLGDYHLVNNLIGWDAVCLVNIVRSATQVHYIERSEFVTYASPIKKQLQTAYANWHELVLAYVVGSLIWQYSDERAQAIIGAAQQFLTDSRSPVHVIKFK